MKENEGKKTDQELTCYSYIFTMIAVASCTKCAIKDPCLTSRARHFVHVDGPRTLTPCMYMPLELCASRMSKISTNHLQGN